MVIQFRASLSLPHFVYLLISYNQKSMKLSQLCQEMFIFINDVIDLTGLNTKTVFLLIDDENEPFLLAFRF